MSGGSSVKKLLLIVALLGVLASGACKKQQTSNGKKPSGIPNPSFVGDIPEDALVDDCTPGTYGAQLVIGTPYNPETFNVITGIGSSMAWVVDKIVFNSIVGFDNAQQQNTPELAKSWDVSPDGLTWTIHLRKGIRWSDGEPFTADDVMFSYQVISDPQVGSGIRSTFEQSDGTVPTLEKVDDSTVRFKLKDPTDLLAALNDFRAVPKHKWESVYKAGNFRTAMSGNADPKDIVGTGPYKIVSFAPDQSLILERNPYYWKVDSKHQRLPYIDKVVFLIVPNNSTWNLKMENGELDLYQQIQQGVDELKRYQEKSNYTVYDLGPSFTTSYMAFNLDTGNNKNGTPHVDPVKMKWFQEVKFRQAVAYAIDRDALIRTALGGRGVPSWEPDFPANKQWYTDNVTKRPYDPEKARELLKEIGIYDRNGDGIAEDNEGHPVKFSLMTNANNSVRVNTITLIKDNLKKVGLDVNLDPVDMNVVATRLHSSRDFDAVLGTWQTGVPPDPIESKLVLLPTGEQYVAFPKQKELKTDWEKQLQDLLNKSFSTSDLAQRQNYYHQAMKVWSDYLPEIDLTSQEAFAAAKNYMGNLKPSALPNFLYWNIDELYFKY